MFANQEPRLTNKEKLKLFVAVHWRGLVCLFIPLLFLTILLPSPPKPYQWTAYCLAVMGVFWVTECIPLAVTSFLPVIIFPMTGIMGTADVCKCYVNDSLMMFLGSLILAYSVEQSGLHERLAYLAIRSIGYSHTRAYPLAPEYLSFPKFSAFAVPFMILLDFFMLLYMLIIYIGYTRPKSEIAKKMKVSPEGLRAAQETVNANYEKLGKLSFWEGMVILLFGGAMVAFFCRSPQIFKGWGDAIDAYFNLGNVKFARDSALAALVVFLMFLLPSNLSFFKNYSAKFYEELPKTRVRSVLDWKTVIEAMPYSFTFLLGGGFALSEAAKKSGLNDKIGEVLQHLKVLPNMLILLIVIIFVVLITNIASNVAVANVITPICMTLAREIRKNPLLYVLASGFSASFCFMLPIGTPGNLVVQSAAKIPTSKMIKAGLGPTISTILITWLMIYYYAPVIWPDLHTLPAWA